MVQSKMSASAEKSPARLSAYFTGLLFWLLLIAFIYESSNSQHVIMTIEPKPVRQIVVTNNTFQPDRIQSQKATSYYGYPNVKMRILSKLKGNHSVQKYYDQISQNNKNFVQIKRIGRLGNYMTLTAILIGVALKNNLVPIYEGYQNSFEGAFRKHTGNQLHNQNITWTVFKAKGSCDNRLLTISKLYPKKNMRIEGWLQCSAFHQDYTDLIRHEFTFRQGIIDSVVKFFQKYEKRINGETTLVGIHVRRGDMFKSHRIAHGNRPSTQSYFRNAINYYIDKHGDNILFIVCSHDWAWVRKNIVPLDKRVILSTAGSPAVDMAILSACDHTIVTLGSFSSWASFLAAGHVVRQSNSLSTKFVDPRFNVTRQTGHTTTISILNSNQDILDMNNYLNNINKKSGTHIKLYGKTT